MIKHTTAFFIVSLLVSCGKRTNESTMDLDADDFELSPETAHPNAKRLLTEDFYWSPIEETGPFGSDAGSDSFYFFVEWRKENRDVSPLEYLDIFMSENDYPSFDLNVAGSEEVKQLIAQIGARYLTDADAVVVAVGFGQFVLEGKVDGEVRELTRKAITRELMPELLTQYRADFQEKRKSQLEKMLLVTDKM